MPFNASPNPKNILNFQTTVEKIIVSNIKKARLASIQVALKKAKRVEDIPRLVKVSTAVNNSLDFAWNQGMYGGIAHSESELNAQRNKKVEFGLSYGLSEILNFSQHPDTYIEFSQEDEANEKARRKREAARLRGVWQKRKRMRGEFEELIAPPNINDEELDALAEAERSLNIARDREVLNTLNNRYTALSPTSDFAQTYLRLRRSTISTITEEVVQDEIKENISKFIQSKKGKVPQEKLLKELTEMYSGKYGYDFNRAKDKLSKKQESLRSGISRKELERMEAKIDLDPEVEKYANFLEEEEDILRKAIKRGDSKEELNELRTDLEQTRKQYEDAREKATPAELKGTRGNKIREAFAKQEEELDARVQLEKENKEAEEKVLKEIQEGGKKYEEAFLNSSIELSQLPSLSDDKQRAYDKGEISLKDLSRKEQKILTNRESKLRELEDLRAKLNKVSEKTKIKKNDISKIQDRIFNSEKELQEGNFKVRVPGGNKKAKLTSEEKSEMARLLDLESEGALADLDKDLSITDLERLKDRLNRKANIFDDEKSLKFAERLATTEVSAAYNLGRLQVFLSKGINYVQWISTLDSKTSAFCQSLHKKVFALSDIFEHVMWVQQFPKTRKPEYAPENKVLSPRGIWVPPAHPYCRSYLQPVYMRDDEDKLEKDVNDKKLSDQFISEKKLESRGKDKSLRGFIKAQEKKRDRDSKNFLRNLDVVNTLFRAGVSALAARFAEEGLASYGTELTDEKRILKDDKPLIAALLAGTAVLGVSSMMYFFLKGNLSDSLKRTARSALAPNVPDSPNFLGGMSKKETAALTEEIIGKIQGMGPATKGRFLKPNSEELRELAAIDANAVLSRGKNAYALAMNDLSLDDVAQSLLSNNQVSVNAGDAYINNVYRGLMNNLRTESNLLNRRSLDIIGESFGNIGVAIDVDNIREIQVWANGVANVIPKKGSATLVSGDKLGKALSSNKFRKQVIDTSREAKRMRRVLQEISAKTDDVVTRGRISREITKLNKLVALERLPQLKMTPVVKDLADEMDDLFKADIVKQQDFKDIQVGFESVSKASETVLDRFKKSLPGADILNLDPQSISDIPQLKSLLSEINSSLGKVENTFVFKKGKKFQPGRIEDLIDINDILEKLEMTSQKLAGTSINVNYKSNIDKINEVVSEQMSNDYNFLIARKMEINKRIKELE